MSQSTAAPDINLRIVVRPAMRLAGAKIRTEMPFAKKDIKKLWMETIPQVKEFLNGDTDAVFGISWLVDPDTTAFDYYAAIKLFSDCVLPEGFSEIEVPAGLYAECDLPSREMLHQLYHYFYYEWLPQNKDGLSLGNSPCYEVYSKDFLKTGSLKVYMPVIAV